MSFIIAGCSLLLALLAGIALDDVGVRRRRTTHRYFPHQIARRLFLNGSSLVLSHVLPNWAKEWQWTSRIGSEG